MIIKVFIFGFIKMVLWFKIGIKRQNPNAASGIGVYKKHIS